VESAQALFGEGPTEKERATATSPAAYSTWGGADGKGAGNRHLAGGLLYLAHPPLFVLTRYKVLAHLR